MAADGQEPMDVLVIDDSAYARTSLSDVLRSLECVGRVSTAVDGLDGYRQVVRRPPDLIMLDLEMPNLDGYAFLRLLGSSHDLPVIVVTHKAWGDGASNAVRLGALDFVRKTGGCARARHYGLKDEIEGKIRLLSRRRRASGSSGPAVSDSIRASAPGRAVVIGASTGGPKAVSTVIKSLPESIDGPVFVVVHMPEWLGGSFTQRLGRESSLPVCLAQHGEKIRRGRVYVIPGGFQPSFSVVGAHVALMLAGPAADEIYAPSVDRLFCSAADLWKGSLTGVVMTGMGRDGRRGALRIKELGGFVVAESMDSAVVFGMPEAAISAGAVDVVLPDQEIGPYLAARLARGY